VSDAEAKTFLYFAYGSNMVTRRLQGRTPSARAVGVGYVEGHRLAFDKVSIDGSGKADLEETGTTTDRVFGVLFNIEESEGTELDEAEGLGKGYRKGTVTVMRHDGTAIAATTYIATKKEPALLPYGWYKALVVAGAVENGLPPAYIEWLRTVTSRPDPNAERRAENEKLLFE
jgi:gamma-glutamylcyclotransferase